MTGLLDGIRILELTIAWAGPLAGRMLADLGADVIHVELKTARGIGVAPGMLPPQTGWKWGDLPAPAIRSGVYPMNEPGERPWNRQAVFNKHNRNKRSLCIDLKTTEGRNIFRDLARQADVVLDNYSPHVMRSLGLDYDSLRSVNERIITVSMSGYGQTGPFAYRVSFGPILEAHSGLSSLCGEDDAPLKLGAALPDAIGGISGALAIVSALIEREETGVGRHIDLSQLETYCAMGGDAFLYQSLRREPISPVDWANVTYGVPHGCYPCRGDDAWIAISVESDQQWAALRMLLHESGLAVGARCATHDDRIAERQEIDEAISRWSRTLTPLEAFRLLQDAGVPAFPVMSNEELLQDPHLADRRMFVDISQDDAGLLRWPAFPVRMNDGTDPARYATAPTLGSDNDAILGELCGLSPDEIRSLRSRGIIAESPDAS